MKTSFVVQIVGAPVACQGGVKDSWREAAHWVASQLTKRFGNEVCVEYYDLFDQSCPQFPPDLELPVVIVAGEVLTAGGKISIPAIRRRLETLISSSD